MSTNGCGPGGTSGVQTITLGMVLPHLQGTSSPPSGFASIGSQCLSSAHTSLGSMALSGKTLLFAFVCMCSVCMHACVCMRVCEKAVGLVPIYLL